MKNNYQFSFLFGAGADIAEGMPNGGEFSLEIFHQEAYKKAVKDQLGKIAERKDTDFDNPKQWFPLGFEKIR